MGVFAGGNILLEAAPGLGKTLLGKTLAAALSMRHARIQFTPDLMPADIIGTNIVVEDERGNKEMVFQRGPVFTQPAAGRRDQPRPPKTQSALLEAMQEHHVTVGGKTYELEEPFLVVATQNPEDLEGTYRLPEAQLDRFLFRLRLTALGRRRMDRGGPPPHGGGGRRGPARALAGGGGGDAGGRSPRGHRPAAPARYAARLVRATHPAATAGAGGRASTCGWGPARAASRR